MKNAIKKSNNCFVPFECFLCLEIFEGQEKIHELKNEPSEVVCYDCAEKSEDEVRKKLTGKASQYATHFHNVRKYL